MSECKTAFSGELIDETYWAPEEVTGPHKVWVGDNRPPASLEIRWEGRCRESAETEETIVVYPLRNSMKFTIWESDNRLVDLVPVPIDGRLFSTCKKVYFEPRLEKGTFCQLQEQDVWGEKYGKTEIGYDRNRYHVGRDKSGNVHVYRPVKGWMNWMSTVLLTDGQRGREIGLYLEYETPWVLGL